MGNLGVLRHFGAEVPRCPLCDGPCRHELPRSDRRFPDRLAETPPERRGSNDPEPVKMPRLNRRGRRAIHGPAEDRMVRGPGEDR